MPHLRSIKRESLALSVPYAAPDGELERLIAEIFAEVFGIDQVGANDDFFDVGGDSLLAETLSMAISKYTGRDFQMSWLVEFGSPRRVAALLGRQSSESVVAAPTQAERVRPPIFSVHGRHGFMLPKPAFLQALAKDQKLRMFELPGIRGGQCYKRIEDIAAAYVAQLVEEYPDGPILLAAFCLGGMIGLEMAAQLAERGRPVHQLVLIDPNIPGNIVVNDGRRKGNCVQWTEYPSSQRWLMEKGGHFPWSLLCLLMLGRRTDGCQDEDFADERLRYIRELTFRYKFGRKPLKRRERNLGLRLSMSARAKLNAAYWHYRPRVFNGPAAILVSRDRQPMFQDPSHIWADLLPQRSVHLIAERHGDVVSGAETAHLIQSLFNAALAER